MKDRLQQFLIEEALSPSKFADEIGVQRSSISHILSGRNNPGYDFIQKILKRFPNLNADWLLMGQGKMYKTELQPSLFDTRPEKQNIDVNPPVSEVNSISPDTEFKQETSKIEKEILINTAGHEKTIERIVIFYADKSFHEYQPSS